jgi:hypothetical protein
MRAIGPALSLLLVSWDWTPVPVAEPEPFTTTVEQTTFGPRHHFVRSWLADPWQTGLRAPASREDSTSCMASFCLSERS